MGSNKLKEVFEVEVKYDAFYRGGQIEWSSGGELFFCQCDDVIKVLDVESGKVTSSICLEKEIEDKDIINTFVLSHDNETIISHHKSGLFKLWNWKDEKLIKQWKSIHKGPVSKLTFHENDNLLASGGSDSSVRIWDLQLRTCTHNLRGAQGVISVVNFIGDLVFAAGDDADIKAWDFKSGRLKLSLAGHYSKVTGLIFHPEKNHLISCGRDRVLILWDITEGVAVRTVPMYESIEGMILLPRKFKLPGFDKKLKNGIHVAVAGDKGIIKIVEMLGGHEIYNQSDSLVSKSTDEGSLSVVKLLFNSENLSIAVVSVDHNIIIHNLETFACKKQFVGFRDEILDIVMLGPGNSHLAVATNSIDIKLYNREDMSCQLLKGHTDLVLTLATSLSNPQILLSGAKDNSVRLWLMDLEDHSVKCIGVGLRHTLSVGCVALSQLSMSFFLSVSQDFCLKLWPLPKKLKANEMLSLNVLHTEIAHDKDINSVSVSPNDKLFATGSQDKTIKIWAIEKLTLLGVLRGHRRGIWCVRFSPVDQIVLSSSADCTIKLWALGDLTCIKTFEGHDCSVLRAEFLNGGMQLITTGADGLLKLWSIKTSECMATFDSHESKVWALAVSKDESSLITGGSDSTIILWKDVTEERRQAEAEAKQKLVLQEQELANLVNADQLLAALKLSLSLERPFQTLRIIQTLMKQGKEGLHDTVNQLEKEQKETLLKYATDWNTNSKECHSAQVIISILLDDLSNGNIQGQLLSKAVEGTLPYTERHFQRLTQLLQDLHLLQYTMICMHPQS